MKSLFFTFCLFVIFTYGQCSLTSDELPLEDNVRQETIGKITDSEVLEREEIKLSPDDFTIAEKKLLNEQKHEFQAEINKLMSILINSIYSNKDVFLRELISNGSDAMDKIRYLALLNHLALGNNTNLEIRIKADKENRLLHIRDTGIGMTKADLIDNLGKIAKSGTSEFIEKVKAGGDVNQIGQFGVGFYSAFLVADTVTVTTKHNNDSQYIWESSVDDQTSFTISEDPRGDTLGRGTQISLHIRNDSLEYLEEDNLKDLIKKYSEFITFPIYLWSEKVVEEQEEKVEESEKETSNQEEVIEEVDDDDDEIVEEPKKKEVRYHDWNLINQNKPLWKRKRSEITEEEYKEFYKSITNDGSEPLHKIHFNAEGDVSFTSLLYIPGEKPFDMFNNAPPTLNLKLYVKRVFITERFEDMIPKYLSFIVGVVDSDDLPLSISRETFQHHKAFDIIKKQIVRKAIAMFQEMAVIGGEEYAKLYKRYSINLKVGAIEDSSNRDRLMKLLRFKTNANKKESISLSNYVENMKQGQKEIYYLGGETIESISNSPLMEKLVKKGYDVVFFTEPIDEYLVQNIREFNNGTEKFRFVDISKEGLKLDKEEEETLKKRTEEYRPLTDYLKEVLSKKVEKVVLTTRLSDTPCTLTSAVYGYSANMERIIKAQALHDSNAKDFQMSSKKTLEINPDHPIIKELLSLVNNDKKERVSDIGNLLYDSARISSGYAIEDPVDFSSRIYSSITQSLNIVEERSETNNKDEL